MIDACVEAYPSFITILESDTSRIRGRFLSTALKDTAPFGVAVTIMIALTNLLAPFSEPERRTVMYLLLILISMCAVVKSCIPFDLLRAFLCVTMFLGTFGALALLPSLFEVVGVSAAMGGYILIGIALSVFFIFLWELVGSRVNERKKRDGKTKSSAL